MEYKPYPTYKSSGVEWLGEVPEHWDVKRFKTYLSNSNAGVVIDRSYWGEGNESLFTCQRTPEQCNYEGFPESKRATDKDILVTRNGTPYIHLPTNQAIYSNVVQRCILQEGVDRRLIKYALEAAADSIGGYGVSIESFSFEKWKNLWTSLPQQQSEQKSLISFLDRETTRIDALIKKKQRLIELLKEKRQAVITQAVTKGLDPNVPMKDSGVEWLGEVPEHWFVGRLGYYGLVNNGTTPSKANDEYWFDGDVPWLSSGAVNQETVLTPSEYITRKALTECSVKMLQVGTVIVGMIGQGKTRGMSAILAVSATINQNLAAVVTDNRLSSYYLHYVFKAAYESIRNVGRGGNQAALNCEILSDMKIPVPEYDEQAKIVDAIKSRISKIDVVEEQSERSLSLLKEHRSALITAAVTGQIDVRNLA